MTRFNPLRLTTAALAIAAMTAFTPGCDSGTDKPADPPAANGGGDGHDHDAHAMDPLTIAGRTVTLSVGGEIEPGAESHIDVAIEGDAVDTVRLWIGSEDDANPLKVNLGPTGGHAHAVAPDDLEGAHIIVEIEIDGETHHGSVEVPHHEDGDDHDAGHDEDDDHGDGDGHDHDHDHGDGDGHDHDHD